MKTGIHSSAAGEAELRRYHEILTRWPLPNERVEVPTRQGGTSVISSTTR